MMARTKRAAKPKGLPDGYTPHDGGPMPVDPDTMIVAVIRTTEGLGFNGPQRARMMPDWERDAHDEGLGAIVGYKLYQRGDQPPDRRHRWDE